MSTNKTKIEEGDLFHFPNSTTVYKIRNISNKAEGQHCDLEVISTTSGYPAGYTFNCIHIQRFMDASQAILVKSENSKTDTSNHPLTNIFK